MESAGAAGFGKGMELAYRGSVGGMELGVGPGDGLAGRVGEGPMLGLCMQAGRNT